MQTTLYKNISEAQSFKTPAKKVDEEKELNNLFQYSRQPNALDQLITESGKFKTKKTIRRRASLIDKN